jgi:ABC-type nickel/cobalt efflux system permease component RcnA
VLYFILKCAVSGLLIGAASSVARRYPGFGALIASLPLVSVLGMIWLWREKPDVANMADHAQATFWYVIPSLPMFLVIPALLRRGVAFPAALAAGCALTIILYAVMTYAAPRFGLRL